MKWTCKGFQFAGITAGIKPSGKPDLAILLSDVPAATGAVFTRNRIKAAPVILSQANLRRNSGMARAIVVNSGNANACTGGKGKRAARDMAKTAAVAVGGEHEQVLVASTGVIGVSLPMDKVEQGIRSAATQLDAKGFPKFAEAILTTDKRPKLARSRFRIGSTTATLLGCTKGAGMISPNMATTLTFVVTDVSIQPRVLQSALEIAARDTFNAMTIDGDTSTNDMIAVLANGRAGNTRLRAISKIVDPLCEILEKLARALIREGEGVHHVVEVLVKTARNESQARTVARQIANSPLVKTAIAGQDPNWGRILCAAGNAGVPLQPEKIDLWIGRTMLVRQGVAVAETSAERLAKKHMTRGEYTITLALHQGKSQARVLACDLSHDYVTINADYRT